MQFYYDPVHYRPSAGNAMLNRMLGLGADGYRAFADFGTRITAGNVLDHLRSVRAQRKRYISRDPELPDRIKSYHPADRPVPDGRFEYPPRPSCPAVEWLRRNQPD
ncbi:MAG TPA: hypothetical protein VF987_10285 [Rhodospirillales bacterium]|jgi:hypothetical protein